MIILSNMTNPYEGKKVTSLQRTCEETESVLPVAHNKINLPVGM